MGPRTVSRATTTNAGTADGLGQCRSTDHLPPRRAGRSNVSRATRRWPARGLGAPRRRPTCLRTWEGRRNVSRGTRCTKVPRFPYRRALGILLHDVAAARSSRSFAHPSSGRARGRGETHQMRLTLAAVGAVFTALLQLTVVPYFRIGDAQPELVLVFAVTATTAGSVEAGLISAFFGGLMIDLLAPRPLGMTAFILLVSVGVAALLGRVLDRASYLVPIIAVFVTSLLGGALFLLLYGALREPIAVADPGPIAPSDGDLLDRRRGNRRSDRGGHPASGRGTRARRVVAPSIVDERPSRERQLIRFLVFALVVLIGVSGLTARLVVSPVRAWPGLSGPGRAEPDGDQGDPLDPRPDLRPEGPVARVQRADLRDQDPAVGPAVHPARRGRRTAVRAPRDRRRRHQHDDRLEPRLALRPRPDRPGRADQDRQPDRRGAAGAARGRGRRRIEAPLHRRPADVSDHRLHGRDRCRDPQGAQGPGLPARRPDRPGRRRVDLRVDAARGIRAGDDRARRCGSRAPGAVDGPRGAAGRLAHPHHRHQRAEARREGRHLGDAPRRPEARRDDRREPADGRDPGDGQPADVRRQQVRRGHQPQGLPGACSGTPTNRCSTTRSTSNSRRVRPTSW